MRILLVEDHLLTAQSIQYYFQTKHSVTHVATCRDAEQHLHTQRYDAVILDLTLPDGSAEHLCATAVDQPSAPAVLVVSGKHDIATKVRTLELGADDYITKPFTSPELYARVEAMTRRAQRARTHAHSYKPLVFHGLTLGHHQLSFEGNSVHLTSTEHQLISHFLHFPGIVLSKMSLTTALQRSGEGSKTKNSLEVHLKNLRQKLRKLTSHHQITTHYTLGYCLELAHV